MLNYIEENYPAVFRALSILIVACMAFAIISTVILSVFFKDDNASPELFGHTIYVMEGEHMSPEIPDGSAVFAESDTLEFGAPIGAIALCKLDDGKYIVARIINSEINDEGLFAYRVRYDNQSDDTTQSVSAKLVIGQVKYHSAALGALIRFVISPLGIGCIIVIPCILIVLYKIHVYKNGKNEFDTESKTDEENTKEENYIDDGLEQQNELPIDRPVAPKVKVAVSSSRQSAAKKKKSPTAVKVVKVKLKQLPYNKYESFIETARTDDVKIEMLETDENNAEGFDNPSNYEHELDFAEKKLADADNEDIKCRINDLMAMLELQSKGHNK